MTGSAATRGWSAAITPRPASRCWPTTRTSASRCPASGCRWACTAAPSRRTARWTSRASPSRACPGVIIGHNADIAWGFTNLDPDVTDLFLERVRTDEWRYDKEWRPLDVRTETIEVRGGRRRGAADPADRPRSAALRRARRARHRRRQRGRAGARGLRRLAGVDGAAAVEHRRRDPRAQPGHGLGRVPRRRRRLRRPRAEHGVRRPRGPHRLPGAGSGARSGSRATTGRCPRRAGGPRTTGPASSCPSTGLPARARPGGGLRRRGQPGRDRRGLPLLPHRRLGPGLPLDPDPRPHRGRPAPVRRRDGGPPDRLAQPDGHDAGALPPRHRRPAQRLLPRRPGPAARLGRAPARVGRGQRRGGVLQRRVVRPAAADLPRRAAGVDVARGRAAVVRRDDGAARRPRRLVVGRQDDRRRRRDARRRAAAGHGGRSRRADQPAGPGRRRTGPGATCTRSTCARRRWGSPASGSWSGW